MKVVILLKDLSETNVESVYSSVKSLDGTLRGSFPRLIAAFEVENDQAAKSLLASLNASVEPVGVTTSRVFGERDVIIMSTRDDEYTRGAS